VCEGLCVEGCRCIQVVIGWAGIQGARTPPPYGAAHIPTLMLLSTYGETGLQSLVIWGYKSLGFDFGFGCPECFGLEISLEGWRKAVSRMAAPRGLTVDPH